MIKYCVFLLALILLAGACLPASAQGRVVPSTDFLPLGDWTFDAMISLASDGLLPGYPARLFQGDRRFNRMEIAEIVGTLIESEERELTPRQSTLVHHLTSEFRPELLALGFDIPEAQDELAPSDGDIQLLGYARALLVEDDGTTRLKIPHRLSGLMHLSDRSFAIVTLADKEEKFFQELRDSRNPDKAFIRGFHRNFAWSAGREYLNWGPAYTGSAILSDNSPALTQVRGTCEFTLGPLGRIKVTQFASRFGDIGTDTWLFGRRYERPLSDRLHLGLSETAKTHFTPNPLILVIPYYAWQHIFGKTGDRIDEGMKVLSGIDLSYRADRFHVYGELAIDDISAPSGLGAGFDVPRKVAYTAGLYFPQVLSGRHSSFRAEFTSIDRGTYSATRPKFPELAYTHKNAIIGHPLGPNTRSIYLRGEQFLTDNISVIGEFLDQRQKDSRNPQVGRRKLASLMAACDLAPNASVAFRVTPYRIVPPEDRSTRSTRYELIGSYGF